MAHIIHYRDEHGICHIRAVKLLEQDEHSVRFLSVGIEITMSRINVIDLVKVGSTTLADYLLATDN